MERLYRLFKDAPVLGSLINPRAAEGDLLEAKFHEVQPLLEKARSAAKEFQNGSLKLPPPALVQLKRRLSELWGDRLELAHSG